jgi:glutathione S-transferase
MKLMINTTSPYTRIVRIALAEKGLAGVESRLVDPWGDTPELLAANSAGRVPTLVTDDGRALTESLLIVLWLERTRPEPSLLKADPTAEIALTGVAMGVIDAAVHILIGRKIAGPSFDDSPVGLRRRRSIVEGLKRIDSAIPADADPAPGLATIASVVALDYVRFRFPDAPWAPDVPVLARRAERFAARPSFAQTQPC